MRAEFLDLPPVMSAAGEIRLPGSKSISNRVLLLSALAEGRTYIHDLLKSDDVDRMLDALTALGVSWSVEEGENERDQVYCVTGLGGGFSVASADLFMGNAGTAIRPLTAALAMASGEFHVRGVARMHERPIGDLVDALRQLGADIDYLGEQGFPPLQIHPRKTSTSSSVQVRGNVSSQFLTALLMAAPLTGAPVRIEVLGELISKPYIAITLALMERFGVVVEQDGAFFNVPAACYQSPQQIYVEGDASSASYFLAAAAIGGGPVKVYGLGRNSIQGDVRFAEALAVMGAEIEYGDNWISAKAPKGKVLRAFEMDLNHIPDAAMTLAIAAVFADSPCELRNIASWRVKETDRIAAMVCELHKLGVRCEEGADYLRVTPGLTQQAATIDTYDDHRMAMCFSLLSLAEVDIRINDPQCVAKTFPNYFQEYARITRPVPVIAIDGPSASGKGTIAARLAEHLGFNYLDSGALYRLVAYAAKQQGVSYDDEAALGAIAESLPVRFVGEQVYLGDEDVSLAIRSAEAGNGASVVAVHPAVRAGLLLRQRAFRRGGGLVGDGRDMASSIFPDAGCMIFITASTEVRAERRYKQLIDKGMSAKLSDLQSELLERDKRDRERSASPLVQMTAAKLIDTSNMSIDEVFARVLEHVYTTMPELKLAN